MPSPSRVAALLSASLVIAGCRGGGDDVAATPSSAPPSALVCHLAAETEVGEALRAVATDYAVTAVATTADAGECDLIVVDGTSPSPTEVPVLALTGGAADAVVVIDLADALTVAGYVAAASSVTATIGVWSTDAAAAGHVEAFAAGVAAYNAEGDADVEVRVAGPLVGEGASADGDVAAAARTVVDELLLDGADAILPLAGESAAVTADAIEDAGAGRLVWVGVGQTGARRPAPDGATVLVAIERDLPALVAAAVGRFLDGQASPLVTAGLAEGLRLRYADEVDADVRAAAEDFARRLTEQG